MRKSRRYHHASGTLIKYMPHISVMIDTSGSMGTDELEQIGGVLDDIYELSEEMYIVHVDADVQEITKYEPMTGLDHAIGRGGTAFSGYFNSDDRRISNADIHIVFTDGMIFDINELTLPRGQTLWVLTEGSPDSFAPPFGDVIEMLSYKIKRR